MPLNVGTAIPQIDGATEWLHKSDSPVVHGGPIMIYFWAMSCPACKANMPRLQAVRTQYEPHGLKVIAVHMPRGPFDLDVEKVKAVAAELGVTEPCAIDNEHEIGDRFEMGGVWPTYFVFDRECRLKRRAAGRFGLKVCEAALRDMFGDSRPDDAHSHISP